MTTAEQKLHAINAGGHWQTPHLDDLTYAVDGLSQTLTHLINAEGWKGASADAAGAYFEAMIQQYKLVQRAVAQLERAVSHANAALDRAMTETESLPSSLVPASAYAAVAAAERDGLAVVRPLPGMAERPLADAISAVAGLLGGNRNNKAEEVLAELSSDLERAASLLAEPQQEFKKVIAGIEIDPIDPEIPDPPVPDPGIGEHKFIIPPSPAPVRTLTPEPAPSYTEPGPVRGTSHPSGTTNESLPHYYTGGNTSADGDSTGYLPGGYSSGGLAGSTGGSGIGHTALTAGTLGGAAAAGAAALRFGTGGGLGSGGLGGAGAAAGSRGLLGGSAASGTTGGSGAGASGSGLSAGASQAAGGAGARGGMMGQAPMGGSGQNKKDKRPGLGGPMAPKLEDDYQEFTPLPDGARAGGRDQLDPDA